MLRGRKSEDGYDTGDDIKKKDYFTYHSFWDFLLSEDKDKLLAENSDAFISQQSTQGNIKASAANSRYIDLDSDSEDEDALFIKREDSVEILKMQKIPMSCTQITLLAPPRARSPEQDAERFKLSLEDELADVKKENKKPESILDYHFKDIDPAYQELIGLYSTMKIQSEEKFASIESVNHALDNSDKRLEQLLKRSDTLLHFEEYVAQQQLALDREYALRDRLIDQRIKLSNEYFLMTDKLDALNKEILAHAELHENIKGHSPRHSQELVTPYLQHSGILPAPKQQEVEYILITEPGKRLV